MKRLEKKVKEQRLQRWLYAADKGGGGTQQQETLYKAQLGRTFWKKRQLNNMREKMNSCSIRSERQSAKGRGGTFEKATWAEQVWEGKNINHPRGNGTRRQSSLIAKPR